MKLEINKKIIERLREEEFYPDTLASVYFIMVALHNGQFDLLDSLDDYNRSRRAIVLYYDLADKGFWQEDPESVLHFKETEKGRLFVQDLLALAEDKAYSEDVKDWIDEWLDLFPKGVRSGGKLIRSDKKTCLSKMEKFIKEYKYSKDVILNATLMYLSEREREDYQYTKCATYFISKQHEGSELASWCDQVQEAVNKNQSIILSHYSDGGLI